MDWGNVLTAYGITLLFVIELTTIKSQAVLYGNCGSQNPCLNDAVCEQQPFNQVICACVGGYSGERCQCAPGYIYKTYQDAPSACVLVTCKANEVKNPCGVCTLGGTGVPATEKMDCSGECYGTARLDSCNACTTSNSSTSQFRDCNQECFGTAYINDCGKCVGGTTGLPDNTGKDKCGVCGGNDRSCLGCDGVLNSGKVRDLCNVCKGDNTTCQMLVSFFPSLIPSTGGVLRVYGAGLLAEKVQCVLGSLSPITGDMVSPSELRCNIPAGQSSGKVSVTVRVTQGEVAKELTAPTKLTIYDASAASVTRINPNMLTIGTGLDEITVVGKGFVSTNNATCVVDGKVSKATYVSNKRMKCFVQRSAKSMKQEFLFSMNGVHFLPVVTATRQTESSLWLTFVASAPSPMSVRMSDSGSGISVFFDSPSALCPGNDLCESSVEVLGELGSNPVCYWKSTTELFIELGQGSSIKSGSLITAPKTGAICAYGEEVSYRTKGQSLPVMEAVNPAKLNPVLKAPRVISKNCTALRLSGALSTGGEKGQLLFQWKQITDRARFSADIDSVLQKVGQYQSQVEIPMKYFKTGLHVFRMGVADPNKKVYEFTEASIQVVEGAVPVITLSAPVDAASNTIPASTGFYITPEIEICPYSPVKQFLWSMQCSDAEQEEALRSSAGVRVTRRQSSLRIDKGILEAGKSCVFTLSVELANGTSGTASLNITAIQPELRPYIVGGDRTVRLNGDGLSLKARVASGADLVCFWSCVEQGRVCRSHSNPKKALRLDNQCDVMVQNSELSPQSSYTFKVSVSSGNQVGDTSVNIRTVSDPDYPLVFMERTVRRHAPSEKLVLRAYYRSLSLPDDVSWTNNLDPGLQAGQFVEPFLPGQDTHAVLVVPGNSLRHGTEYKFSFLVTVGIATGLVSTVVKVRTGPSLGSLSLDQSECQPLESFIMTAGGWVTDPDAYPLQYEFGFYDPDSAFMSWGIQTSPTLRQLAPGLGSQDNLLMIQVRVTDAFGSSATRTTYLNITGEGDEDRVEEVLKGINQDNDAGNWMNAVASATSLSQTVFSSEDYDEPSKSRVTREVYQVLRHVTEDKVLDESVAVPVLAALSQLPADQLPQRAQAMGMYSQLVRGHGDRVLSDNMTKSVMESCDGLFEDQGIANERLNQKAREFSRNLASNLAQDLTPADYPIETQNSLFSIKVQASTLSGQMITSRDPDTSSVLEFGPGNVQKFRSWDCAGQSADLKCMGAQVKIVNYKNNIISENKRIGDTSQGYKIVDIRLQNPSTNDEISSAELGGPVSMRTRKPRTNQTIKCVYYDEERGAWVEIETEVYEDEVICRTNQLGTIATALEDDSANTTILILVVCLSLTLLILVFGVGIGILYYRRRQKNKKDYKADKNMALSSLAADGPRCEEYMSPSDIEIHRKWWEIPRSDLELGKELGSGQFGQVVRGSLKTDGKVLSCAVKKLKPGACESDFKDLFNELVIMSDSGTHPNIVNLIGACSRGGPLLIVVEFCEHGDLLTYLRENMNQDYLNVKESNADLPVMERIRIAYDVAKGMSHLEQKRCVHRDLAARNVLLGEERIAKVSDFGLSRDVYEFGEYEKRSSGKLPVRWMAIESLEFMKSTIKSDVWAYGVLLWEIETGGRTPYTGVSGKELLQLLKSGYRLEKPPHCSEDLYKLMNECWQADPEERPSFTQICERLEGLLEELGGGYVEFSTPAYETEKYGYLQPVDSVKKV